MGLANGSLGQAGNEKIVGSQVGEEIDPAVLGGDVCLAEELTGKAEFAEVDELGQLSIELGEVDLGSESEIVGCSGGREAAEAAVGRYLANLKVLVVFATGEVKAELYWLVELDGSLGSGALEVVQGGGADEFGAAVSGGNIVVCGEVAVGDFQAGLKVEGSRQLIEYLG